MVWLCCLPKLIGLAASNPETNCRNEKNRDSISGFQTPRHLIIIKLIIVMYIHTVHIDRLCVDQIIQVGPTVRRLSSEVPNSPTVSNVLNSRALYVSWEFEVPLAASNYAIERALTCIFLRKLRFFLGPNYQSILFTSNIKVGLANNDFQTWLSRSGSSPT